MSVEASRNRKKRRPFAIIGLIGGIAASGTMVYTASNAAFTARTSNGVNEWNTGSVLLTDDDAGAAMFNVTGLGSNQSGQKCIKVTYSGTGAAPVKLYIDQVGLVNDATTLAAPPNTVGKLGDYINLKIDQIDSALDLNVPATCAAGVGLEGDLAGPAGGTLTALSNAHQNYGNGMAAIGPWAGVASSRWFRFSWDSNAMPNDAGMMNKKFRATFAWEAQG